MKRTIKVLILAFVLVFAFVLSGCINSEAVAYELQTGVTAVVYSDGTDYRTDFIITVPVATMREDVSLTDEYLFAAIKTGLDTTRGDVKYQETEVDGQLCYTFYYYSVIPEEYWFFTDDHDPEVDYGLFNIKVNYDMPNPFSKAYKAGHPFNTIYNTLRYSTISLPAATSFFWGFNIDNVNTSVMMGTRRTSKTDNGKIIYIPEDRTHYYRVSALMKDTNDLYDNDANIEFNYTVMASYTWFAIAVLLGIITVVLILLLAKKKSGKIVDLTPKQTEVFMGFNSNNYDIFGDGNNGNNNNDNNPGSGGGGVFDGF